MFINANALCLPLAADSAQCIVTSPPYFGLRDYGVAGQIGAEHTPSEYVAQIAAVMRECWRVLKADGTLWLNIGDSYANDSKWGGRTGGKHTAALHGEPVGRARHTTGLPPKSLIGIPWRVAFALQDDGWYLRSDIIWHKTSPMPESVTDRPTRSHEHVFLLTKRAHYFYDSAAIAEPSVSNGGGDFSAKYAATQPEHGTKQDRYGNRTYTGLNGRWARQSRSERGETRNARDVWTISPQPYGGAHFASMPSELARRCILAGTRPGDLVLDPFSGAGTTALAALQLNRRAIGIELNQDYIRLAQQRTAVVQPVLSFPPE